jgi:hypothetical protein
MCFQCTRFPHVVLCMEHAFSVHGFLMSCCVWNMLSVYTVSSCRVVYGTCFQCIRFPHVVLCKEHAFSVHGFLMSCCVFVQSLFNHDAGKDIGKTGDAEADLYQAMVWIPPFAHVLVKWFGQLYATDGTHNMSKYGWRAIPLCVVNSLGNPHPVGMIWATSECHSAMILLADHLSQHLQENGCVDPFSLRRDSRSPHVDPRDLCYRPDWEDPLPSNYACAPPYRLFVNSVLTEQPILADLPPLDERPTLISDGGLAFRSFSECLGWRQVLCKKHLSANNSISSTTHK